MIVECQWVGRQQGKARVRGVPLCKRLDAQQRFPPFPDRDSFSKAKKFHKFFHPISYQSRHCTFTIWCWRNTYSWATMNFATLLNKFLFYSLKTLEHVSVLFHLQSILEGPMGLLSLCNTAMAWALRSVGGECRNRTCIHFSTARKKQRDGNKELRTRGRVNTEQHSEAQGQLEESASPRVIPKQGKPSCHCQDRERLWTLWAWAWAHQAQRRTKRGWSFNCFLILHITVWAALTRRRNLLFRS